MYKDNSQLRIEDYVFLYHDQYGRWPERILADKIYRNRQTLAFAKSIEFVCQAQRWTSSPRMGPCRAKLKSWNIRTAATATWWRVFLELARPLIV